jgi:hypothetical protein
MVPAGSVATAEIIREDEDVGVMIAIVRARLTFLHHARMHAVEIGQTKWPSIVA